MPDRPVRAHLVVVSAPILQLFGGVGKGQEPVGVQVLRPEATVEGFDVGVVGGLSRPAEVERHAFRVFLVTAILKAGLDRASSAEPAKPTPQHANIRGSTYYQ